MQPDNRFRDVQGETALLTSQLARHGGFSVLERKSSLIYATAPEPSLRLRQDHYSGMVWPEPPLGNVARRASLFQSGSYEQSAETWNLHRRLQLVVERRDDGVIGFSYVARVLEHPGFCQQPCSHLA